MLPPFLVNRLDCLTIVKKYYIMVKNKVWYTPRMYPRDAITISTTIRAEGTYTLIPATTTPYTILSGTVSGTGSGGDEQGFLLGTSTIYIKGDVAQQAFLHLVYAGVPLRIFKTGNSSTTFAVTYVPRDRRSTFDPPLSATSSVNFSTSSINLAPQMNELSYIYLILATVAVLFYIFKK